MDKSLIVNDAVDGDYSKLDLQEVGGFGEPMLALFVAQEGDECSINLDKARAAEIIAWLSNWVKEVEPR